MAGHRNTMPIFSFDGRSSTQNRRIQWTRGEDKVFEQALVVFPEGTPDRWSAIAARLPGRSANEVFEHYNELIDDLMMIERGNVELPEKWDDEDEEDEERKSSETGRGRVRGEERRRGVPWTEEEHRLFLEGLAKYGKGDWRNISRWAVKSRTPTQVASHAQKFFIRQNQNATHSRDTKRKSIHDITNP